MPYCKRCNSPLKFVEPIWEAVDLSFGVCRFQCPSCGRFWEMENWRIADISSSGKSYSPKSYKWRKFFAPLHWRAIFVLNEMEGVLFLLFAVLVVIFILTPLDLVRERIFKRTYDWGRRNRNRRRFAFEAEICDNLCPAGYLSLRAFCLSRAYREIFLTFPNRLCILKVVPQ